MRLSLSRKLPPGEDTIRLCSRNFACDIHTPCKLLDMEGEVSVFISIDEGENLKLKTFNLKECCPVMMLKKW